MGTLDDLRQWYTAQCDEEWEHSFGVKIQTLDNPGWRVTIDLDDTILVEKPFDPVVVNLEATARCDLDASWLICKVENHQFTGAGDSGRLEEILQIFLDWAKTEPDWLAIPAPQPEEDRDRLFWSGLGEEIGGPCQGTDCARQRITYSVYCRRHHFEALRHKPCPFDG